MSKPQPPNDQSPSPTADLATSAEDQRAAPRAGHGRALIWGLLFCALLAALAVPGARWMMASSDTVVSAPLTAKVDYGGLTLTVTERGTLESANNLEVRCEVPKGGILQYVVPDGSIVKPGDLIAKLDSAGLELLIMTQEIAFERAKAAKIQTEQMYAVAAIAVREYTEGTFINDRTLAETTIVVAEEALRSAQNTLAHNTALNRKGYVSDLELGDFEFAVQKAELDLATATTTRDVIVNFTKPKMLAQLESARDAAMAQMRAAQRTFDLELEKLTLLRGQLKTCEIFAPTAGLIVHANDDNGRSTQGPSIQEGAVVRERQIVVRMPDLTQMQVRVAVHESKVELLKTGMRSRVWIQDRELLGTVASVAQQPMPANFMAPTIRQYYAIVRIDGSPENLRPGMTAQVEILVDHMDKVLSVPADSVVESEAGFACWVKSPLGFAKRPVTLGRSNTVMVEVKRGLAVGDEVLLNPRTVLANSRQFKVESISAETVRDAAAEGSLRPPVYAQAKRKDLEVDFRDQGLVNSQDSLTICCLVPGEPLIAWIIEDGAIVEPGQELVTLDGSTLETEIGAQEILVTRAMATRASAELTYNAAKAAVGAYLDGEYRQLLKTAEATIAVAAENLKTANITLKNTENLARQGFVTELQLEAQRFAVRRTQLEYDYAVTARNTLVNFTKVKMEEDLRAQRDIAEATLRAEEAAYKVEAATLDLKRDQLAKCTYKAPRAGLVVHANSSFRRMEPGASLYYARQICRLPDLSKMQVELRVHESAIERLKVGLPATIEVNAQRLSGVVRFVGNLPAPPEDTGFMMPMAPVKEFLVHVGLTGDVPSSVKPGMTGEVTIHIARAPRAICVPVDAVVEQDGEFYCWTRQGGRYVRKPVLLGQTNLTEIEIRDGVAEGERVVLNPIESIPESRMQALEPATLALVQDRYGTEVALDVQNTSPTAEIMPGGN